MFIWQYWQETRGAARNYPLQLWDGALIFLLYASLGGWGLAIITRLPVEDPFWSLAFTHIFLDTFAFGWFLLALLGLAYTTNPAAAGSKLARTSINLVVIGMPVIFLLGMPQHVVPALALAGRVGRIAGSGRICWGISSCSGLWREGKWKVPLFFLGLNGRHPAGHPTPFRCPLGHDRRAAHSLPALAACLVLSPWAWSAPRKKNGAKTRFRAGAG